MSDKISTGYGVKARSSEGERRRFPRVKIQQRLWCERDGLTVLVETKNISLGGLCVASAVRPIDGARFLLSFRRSNDELVLAPVEVAWHRLPSRGSRTCLGLRFLDERKGEKLYESFLVRKSERRSVPPLLQSYLKE